MHLSNKSTARLAWFVVVPGIVLGLLFALMGFLEIFTGNDPTDPATAHIENNEVAAGRDIYLQYCAVCHAPDAGGIPGLGKDLIESEFVQNNNDEDLRTFIIQGRTIDDPANTTGVAMPARGGNSILSDSEIDQIIVYLRYRAE